MVIEDLYDMHVPSWLLLILTSYLTERSMIMSYNGAKSSPRSLPGSSPQGAFLGIFLFVVKYNAASLRPQIPRLLMNQGCTLRRSKCKQEQCPQHAKDAHMLYIDDLSEAEGVDLKKQIVTDPVQRPFPLNYHERTKQIFPADRSILQTQLLKVENYTIKNKMKINESKSKIMIFNKSRNYDFPPELAFRNGQNLEVFEETKLLGLVLTSDLRWHSNTWTIYTKAMSKMWLLRRMKVLKLDPHLIFDYYAKEIRVLAEQAVSIWNSGLTKGQIKELEKIQKVALKIILGDNYCSYSVACNLFDIKPLTERRLQLCTSYALKLYQSDRSSDFFTHSKKTINTRGEMQLLVENKCRTTRCYNAPHNYLARLVNLNQHKLKTSEK